MNHTASRLLCVLLCLVLVLLLLPGAAYADAEIWYAEPTGWTSAEQVQYQTVASNGATYVLNWGVRGERSVFLTSFAQDYYPEAYLASMGALAGGLGPDAQTGADDVPDSPLYAALHSFLADKQSAQTNYDGTKLLYKYTDCMISDYSHISSFYSGIKLNGAWDSGATWNREHTWPNSKCSSPMEDDIMMLRPTSTKENSSRGNTAYGEGSGYYHPNSEAGNRFDLRGDCARICLYCYVRWPSCWTSMWGQGGVIESLEVLLDWMEQDPVDTWEMGRNDAVQSITGVRNCFVDYPELAWALFSRPVPAQAYPTPSQAEPEPGVPEPPFRFDDVQDESAYYFLPVYWAYEHEPRITAGTDATHFSPNLSCGREQVVSFLWKAIGAPEPEAAENPFADVAETDYFYKPVMWAVENGVTSGVGEGLFGVGQSCTRGQVVSFLWAASERPSAQSSTNRFLDVQPDDYFHDAVLWALERGIVSGTSQTSFTPNRACLRCEIVTMLCKWATLE